MQGSETYNSLKAPVTIMFDILLRFLPMLITISGWTGNIGVKTWSVTLLVRQYYITCILGALLLLICACVDFKKKPALIINSLGNVLFWGPLFIDTIVNVGTYKLLTIWFYVAVVVVSIAIWIQTRRIIKHSQE